jgi:hypothetical protein
MTDDLPNDDTHDEVCGCLDCQRTDVFAATDDVRWALLYRHVPDAESGDVATVAAQRFHPSPQR